MRQRLCCGLLLLLFLITVPLHGAPAPRLVKIGAFNYYPGIFKDVDGSIKGFYVDALADMAKQENLRIEYVYGSWQEGLDRIKTGEVDLLTSVAYTPERASYMDYTTTPLLTVWGELYTHPNSHLANILEVRDKKIAVMRGDFNGQSFIELTKKFGIPCTFVEMPGFDDVFRAIVDKKVDAGVVNSTYGIPKHKDYGLRSTGIVFNPFNIYITAAKGKNRELLQLVNEYLHHWQQDKNSVYALAREKWQHTSLTGLLVIPFWLQYTAFLLSVLVITAIIFILVLRRQVSGKTTELLEQKNHLKHSNDTIKLLLDSTAEGIYGLDTDGNCTFCNATCLSLLGYNDEQQLLGNNMHDLVHHTRPDNSPYAISDCPIARSFRTGSKNHCATELFWRSDGTGFPVEYWSYPIVKDNAIIGAVVTFVDITERKQVELSLRESEERYRSIFENGRSVMLVIDSATTAIVDANPAAAAFYGWPREELRQMQLSDINLLSTEQIAENIQQAQAENRYYFNFKHRLADGSVRDVEVFSGPIQSGGETLLFSIIHDITERKRVEEILVFLLQCGTGPNSEDFFRSLARYLGETLEMDYVFIDRLIGNKREAETVAIYKNGTFDDNLHYALDDTPCSGVVGKTICRINSEVRKHYPHDTTLQELQAESYIGTTLWGFDGTPIGLIALISRKPLPDNSPAEAVLQVAAIRASAELERKLSEQDQRLLEEQLRHAQRMEAIGTLAGGVAHDFNNILTAIVGYAHIAQIGLPADSPQRGIIQQITEAANRATHLTRDLLLFSRKQTASKRQVELNELVCNTKTFLQRIIGENITLTTGLAPHPVLVNADPQQLDQVLMNLTTNASHAMPDGGTITITLSQALLDENAATEYGLTKAGPYAMLRFSDTGIGIPQEHLDKIFDPFFTTKEVGKGTGLGLPIVYGIVKAHEGSIQIESSLEAGTVVTICMPCAEQQQESVKDEPQPDEPLPRGTNETILLAEDAERIRDMASQVLTEFGYQVLTAVDGDDAIRMFQENSDRIDLLLFDLVMPNKGGYEAYQQIQKVNPSVPIIFITGYAPEVATGKLTEQQLKRLLHKPFAITQLLKGVREALDAQGDQQ